MANDNKKINLLKTKIDELRELVSESEMILSRSMIQTKREQNNFITSDGERRVSEKFKREAVQAIYSDEEIKNAYSVDAEVIALSFQADTKLGIEIIRSSMQCFMGLLVAQKGRFVPSMDLDYRRYVVGLLVLTMEKVEEPHKEIAFKEIVLLEDTLKIGLNAEIKVTASKK